jgi:acetyl esterase/lipase
MIGHLLALLLNPVAAAPPPTPAAWAAQLASDYSVSPNITYLEADGVALKLDVYAPRRSTANPVVVYFHGGGWAGGDRERAVLRLMPYLEMGFTVVNATYRGARVALAPAAVEDCRCVLRWVAANAAAHKLDLARIVVTGDSAGSHLALTTGLMTADAGMDGHCAAGGAEPRVAAIINWFGATDVADLVEGSNAQKFAADWIGSRADRMGIARRLSPLTYVRRGAPPVLTIHGQADRVVPHHHAVRLHDELRKHGVRNQLISVPGGGHGDFTRDQNEANYSAIRAFLDSLSLLPSR